MNSQPVVLLAEPCESEPLNWLRERARVIEAGSDQPSFAEHLRAAEGLYIRTYTRVNEAFLAGAPRLKVVARAGVGIENIDVAACRRHGVEVVYTPDANTLAVGDFVFQCMLALLRPIHSFSSKAMAPAQFKQVRETLRGRQLNELTLGILGMGRVGRRVGHIAAAGFGMKVLYNDLLDVAFLLDFPAEAVQKEQLFRRADVLSIHVDMRPGNENLVSREQLALMKPQAILINTSRGEVLDASALADALRAGKLAGAALDVYWPEPPREDFPLLGVPNVLLTPHIASRTYTAVANMSWVVRDLIAVLEGKPPRFPAPLR